ncbi:MAG: class I SAM-dependent methyltransferase [Deltaproteobacteria bacterium]|nr:class I SAM-dependent methyltransferase [Deltaproteobacteria bacterium]
MQTVDISKLTGIPETMLITVRARALESQKKDPLVIDKKALDILSSLSTQDTSKTKVSPGSQVGVLIRTKFLDNIILNFIGQNQEQNQDSVIVNLGAGLDARCERLKRGNVKWIDVDLPEVISIRNHFFRQSDTYKMVAASLMDFKWMEYVDNSKPVLFVAEGVLMYLEPDNVQKLLKEIAARFPGSQMTFDVISPWMVKHSYIHPDVKKYKVQFNWGIDSEQDLEKVIPCVKVIQCEKMMKLNTEKWPLFMKILCIFPFFRNSSKLMHIQFPPA